MPELPEVETMARGLRALCVGRRIARIEVRQPLIVAGPYRKRWRQVSHSFSGMEITQVDRRAKRLIIHTTGPTLLVFQLGMTGKFLISDPGADSRKHVHLVVHFENGLTLRFCDPRRFGRVWFIEHPASPEATQGHTGNDLDASMRAGGMTRLGPEPFDLSAAAFREILRGSRPVKALLLDQARIAGLGNIYADESLYAARIHPAMPAGRIEARAAGQLLAEIVRVLNLSIAQGGTTFSDYRNPYGDMGEFRQMLQAYGREGEPCGRCGRAIERVVIIGRSSHFCPRCQRPKKITLPMDQDGPGGETRS